MRVDVLNTVRRLAGQTRRVEVVDVGDLGVEEVERLQHETRLVRKPISNFAIPDRGALRGDTPILDERPRAKMTDAEAAEERLSWLDRQARRDHAVQRAGNLRPCGIVIGEARAS